MRAKWLILLKVQLTGLLGINKAKHSDDARVKRRTAGGIAAVCIVGFVILFYAALIAVGFCLQGLGKNLPALSVALSSLIVFIFTLFQGRNLLFSAKDYDAVMSLPVSHGEIILSRLLCAYLSNLAFALAIALPVHVVYFVFEGFSPGVFGTALLASLLSPVLPLTLGAALSVLAAGLTARMKHRNLLQTLLAVAFFVAAMVASFSFSFSANAGENGPDLSAMFGVLVGKMYPPALLVDKTVSGDAVWGIFAFAGISLAAGALFVAIVSLFFAKINTALLSRASRAGYRTKDVRASSAFSALVKKEFKRLVSGPAYLLNGCCGILILLLFAAVLPFVNLQSAFDIPAEEYAEVLAVFANMGAGLSVMLIAMSCPSASALSLEGSSRAQMLSMPLSARSILLSKCVPTFCIDCAGGLLFALSFGFKMQAGAANWAALLLTPPVFAAFIALAGIWLNVKFPKYDWTTETQAVKSSVPVFVTVFGGMVFGMAVMALAAFFGALPALVACALAAALCVPLFLSLKRADLRMN